MEPTQYIAQYALSERSIDTMGEAVWTQVTALAERRAKAIAQDAGKVITRMEYERVPAKDGLAYLALKWWM